VALKRVTSSSKSANVVLEIDGQLSGCVVGDWEVDFWFARQPLGRLKGTCFEKGSTGLMLETKQSG
jgi:hypothetical protein